MAHKMGADDNNIIKKCREYKFCCTYDEEKKFQYESVTDAIYAVLASREQQSEKLHQLIARTDRVMVPLQKLIDCAKELDELAGKDAGPGTGILNGIGLYVEQLEKKSGCLEKNLHELENAKRVMDRKYIHVPVVGVINSGKSTFLHSALGGRVSDRIKENLFPSGGALTSCTGTRTVLIYDDHSEGIQATAIFKDKAAFINDCKRSVRRMIEAVEEEDPGRAGLFSKIQKLEKDLTEASEPIALLKNYYQSAEFKSLCKIRYKDERHMESVYDFCSFVHFSMDENYWENRLDSGMPNHVLCTDDLVKSWEEGTNYSLQISSEDDFAQVKSFVCKYNPDIKQNKNRSMEQGMERYTAYCGVKVVEIRGNLCGDIAGLELIDSVGANDDAISNKDQMEALMQDSDAMILLERPQSQARAGWSVTEYVKFVREQKKSSEHFLHLVYNCYDNNTRNPSELSYGLDNAKKYYSEDCKKIYVSDIGEWEEVQSKMLVDMLVNLSNSVEKTHEEYINLAEKAKAEISDSFAAIRQIATNLGQSCSIEDENASEKRSTIDEILKTLFGKIEELILETKGESETNLRVSANEVTQNLVKNLEQDFETVGFGKAYEYVSPTGPRYMYNRYVAYLCMYSRMLENARRRYNVLKNGIHTYVNGKRRDLLKIFWVQGRFQSILSGSELKVSSEVPKAEQICEWLKKDGRELLAGVLEDLLLQDIGAESLIDRSIGKVIGQFEPKNLTAEQLFGQKLSDPGLEENEGNKTAAIVGQLSAKAEELKAALLQSLSGNVETSSVKENAGNKNTEKKKEDDDWIDDIINKKNQDSGKTPDNDAVISGDEPTLDENLFDLDQKVRKDVVCDGILQKVRDKLRGEGLQPNAEQELYNLYDHYYEALLTEEEADRKRNMNRLRRDTNQLAGQLVDLCEDGK